MTADVGGAQTDVGGQQGAKPQRGGPHFADLIERVRRVQDSVVVVARANSPRAGGIANTVATACAPALSPKIVTSSGSPPKSAIFSPVTAWRDGDER